MTLSDTGLALIRRFEGFSPTVYLCPAGVATIGYGHVVRADEQARFARGISEPMAVTLLRQDAACAEAAVARLIAVPLTQGQFDALVSFTFNLGAAALQRSTLRQRVNREDHAGAREEFAKWVWAGGRRLTGLVARRAAEALRYAA